MPENGEMREPLPPLRPTLPLRVALVLDGTSILRPQLVENIDFTFVPEEAWNSLVQWYKLAEGQEPIARRVIDQGIFNRNCSVEVYLIDLSLCHSERLDSCFTEYFSRTATLEQVEKVMRKMFNIADDKEVKLWNKCMTNTYGPLKELSNTLFDASLYAGQVIVIEEKNSNDTWTSQAKLSISSSGAVGDVPATRGYSGSADGSYDSSYSKNGVVTPGVCGLSNLGNTCFMNSAIQCMNSVPPLTDYMLSGRWREELNSENPFGTSGKITTSYAELIKNMWSGKYTCTEPSQFKTEVGTLKQDFSENKEQDMQELLAFLLDGLHEDLNRVKKKPYIETKEAGNRSDEEVSTEAWQDYLLRNNSVIVDIFHGLFKSTVVCFKCSKVSVKFDPFCYLSLPLPVKKEYQMTIFFVPVNSKLKIQQCKVTVPKMGVVNDLYKAVSALSGAPHDQLVVADVYNHRFHKFYSANELLRHLTDRGDIFVFEVPVKSTDPDTVVVPVYMREVRGEQGLLDTVYSQLFGQPLLVPFPRNSSSFEVLYNTLLDCMARYVHRLDESISSSSTNADDSSNSLENPDEMEFEEMEISPSTVEKKEHRIFSLRLVNSYGSADFDEIIDDGIPVKLSNNTYLAADWTSEAKKKFYDEKEAKAIAQDDGMNQIPTVRKPIQLYDCIELFTTMEKMDEDSRVFCPACNKLQQAMKKFDFWSLPNIMVIQLKRFSHNGTEEDKLDAFVDYPVRNLDMSRFVINPNHGPALYDLIAVSNHYRGTTVNHYTAHAKHKDMNQWFYFDDSSVSQSNEESVVTKAGYVLVYQLHSVGSNKLDAS